MEYGLGIGIPLTVLALGVIYRMYNRPRQVTSDVDLFRLSLGATIVNLSYKDPDRYTECVRKIETDRIRDHIIEDPIFLEDSETDSQAYIWKVDNSIYLCYRGTEDIKDVIADIDIRTEPIDEEDVVYCCTGRQVRIHQGFHRQFFALESLTTSNIQTYIESGANSIYIYGHSLGGALASIATYYYSKKYPTLSISTMTFGSPRVGNSYFARDPCHQNTLRVYNYHDPVSIIPLSFRFEHVDSPALCLDDSLSIFCQHRLNLEYTRRDLYWLLRPISCFRINFWSPGAPHSSSRYRDSLLRLYN